MWLVKSPFSHIQMEYCNWTAGQCKHLVLFDENDGQVARSNVRQSHRHAVYELRWNSGGSLISCSEDRTIRIWANGAIDIDPTVIKAPHFRDQISCICVPPDDVNTIVCGTIKGDLLKWTRANGSAAFEVAFYN